MKNFLENLENNDSHVGLLAAANLGLSGVQHWVANLGELFSVLIPASQIAVAIATVFYLAYRAKLANAEAEATKENRKDQAEATRKSRKDQAEATKRFRNRK